MIWKEYFEFRIKIEVLIKQPYKNSVLNKFYILKYF
jgi:hypothetical protein